MGRDGLVGRDDREKGGMGQKKVLHVGRRLNGSGVLSVSGDGEMGREVSG